MTINYSAVNTNEIVERIAEHLIGYSVEFNIEMLKDSDEEVNFKVVEDLMENALFNATEIFLDDLMNDIKEDIISKIKSTKLEVKNVKFNRDGFADADVNFA